MYEVVAVFRFEHPGVLSAIAMEDYPFFFYDAQHIDQIFDIEGNIERLTLGGGIEHAFAIAALGALADDKHFCRFARIRRRF